MNRQEELKNQINLTVAHSDFQKGMIKYSFFKLNDHSVSDDLVQDTFIKTWSYLARGGNILLMRSFLYRVLNDLIVDQYRKKKPISLDNLLEKGYEKIDKSFENNINILDGKIAVMLVEKLSPKYQKVIKMKFVQELSLKEISLITGQTKNTIAVQIHRGIEKLRNIYNHKIV